MKLALLGCDDEALALVHSALTEGSHVLAAAYDVGRYQTRLRQLAPLARYDEAWESLLVGTQAEAVIVARGKFDSSAETGFSADDRRADQLRKLTQAAVPMLVVHPACEMIVGYELEMIRADSGGVMLPYVPGLFHPAIAELESLAAGGPSPLAEVEQVTLERQMADRSRGAVLVQFARDAALLRRLLGTIHQIAATGPAGNEYHDPLASRSKSPHSLANLNVHLSGERPFSARWSVGPVDDLPGAKMVLVGARGRATLRMPDDPQSSWQLDLAADERQQREYARFHAPADALNRLQAAMHEQAAADASWMDACRDLDAASAVDRSLERGRAIALYTDEVSQEQSFKGVMAVGGCLILAVTMLGVGIVVLVEALQLELRRSPYWRLWPLYLLAPIVVFLVLQTLQIVARRREPRGTSGDEPVAGDRAG